jgi:hypothetical protein
VRVFLEAPHQRLGITHSLFVVGHADQPTTVTWARWCA